METLKWSAFALSFLCILSSCTKSTTDTELQLTASNRGGPANNGTGSDVDPGLTVTFNPSPATENQTVTVTATFDGSTAQPDCGKLQLFQKVGDVWEKKADIDVTASVHEAVYSFSPTLMGSDVYEFRVHYIAGNCSGFNQVMSGSFYLDVEPACQGLTLTGAASAVPDVEPGYYQFTVTYTVNVCNVPYSHLKTQGGLTAFSTQVTTITAGGETREAGSSSHPNTIIKWEEWASLPGGSKTYSATFKKAWSGSGPVELTGQWSVKADLNGTETAVATFPPIIYQ